MKKLAFLIPIILLFSGCKGLYVIPVPINNMHYTTESYYTAQIKLSKLIQ
jgi:hypothetical protein